MKVQLIEGCMACGQRKEEEKAFYPDGHILGTHKQTGIRTTLHSVLNRTT